jgi:uncharacterized protein (UPF0210 family)
MLIKSQNSATESSLVLIRALAFMCDPAVVSNEALMEEYLRGLAQQVKPFEDVARSFKSEIWTKRIVLPRFDVQRDGLVHRISDLVEDVLSKVKVNYVALPLGYFELDRMADELATCLGGSKSLLCSVKLSELGVALEPERALSAARLLKLIAETAGPLSCARFAFSCGDQLGTPYFPDTASDTTGFTLSMRYVHEVQEIFEKEKGREREEIGLLLKRIEAEAIAASEHSSLKYAGMDCSLSPWMEESAADLVSTLLNGEFGGPGTHHAVFLLNQAIREASQGVKTRGFNELMLPVGEDSTLKRLALDGRITLSTLISLISVCVVGLDMVVLPLSTDPRVLAKVLSDIAAIVSSKGRTAGIRIILVDGKPGDEVELGQFGKIPIMDASR